MSVSIFNSVLLAELASNLGSGRLVPTIAAAVGLLSVAVGGAALNRSHHAATRRKAALVASTFGLFSLVIGGMHAANAAGGLGTGNGLAGAYVAVGLSLASAILGAAVLVNLARRA